jgi:hypothetical protein
MSVPNPLLFKNFPLYLSIPLLLLLAGCAGNINQHQLSDLEQFSQSPTTYLHLETSLQQLVPKEQQALRTTEFLKNHFLAWHSEAPLELSSDQFWANKWIVEKVVFAENLKPLPPERIRDLIDQTDEKSYPSLMCRAISLRRCSIRALPTKSPLYLDPQKAGEGFPFDYLQHAVIPANTPLLVTHSSKDHDWFYVETALTSGWLPVADLAWVDDNFIRDFEGDRYVTQTLDNTKVTDALANFYFDSGIGSLLPVIETTTAKHHVLIATADENRQAQLQEASIPRTSAEEFPLPLTTKNIAILAERMMGQPYGWGDRYSGRDCSGTMRDLFAPFGLWLPRNSSKQALEGSVIALQELAPPQREQYLLDQGVPFLTLVRIPGHIMLYLGEYQGRAAVMHTLWGLRTKTLTGREGRWIIGQTVITGLEPGMEQDGVFLKIRNLLGRIESMNILNAD